MSPFLVHFIALCISPVLGDFAGPSYPAPIDLSSNQSLVATAWTNLTSTIQTYLNSGSQDSVLTGLENITFSIGLFSLNDPTATGLQFHYTSPEILNSPNGTHKVDENSIYRIASVTKVFTVLAGLLELKATDWERPLTDIIPTLADFAKKNPGEDNPTYIPEWDKITPLALSAQIAGVPRDVLPADPGELEVYIEAAAVAGRTFDPTTLGLPPLNESDPLEFPPCVNYTTTPCPVVPYIASMDDRPPSFLPWSTPAYADNGFALLGLAISNITGKSMDQVYRESIFNPLGLTSSNSSTPPESEWSRCVIPGDPLVNFASDPGLFVSTGGLSSTLRDLTTFGSGILNSTLLSPDQTRRWLKPVSHTARLQYSVGRPWEIMRYTHPSGHVTDIYPKSGDSGAYSSVLTLLPDYNAGFVLLSSGTATSRFELMMILADVINDSILPALEAQAVIETQNNFVGTYTLAALNSSLTLVLNQTTASPPGLVISSWISNGTDIFSVLGKSLGPTPWRLVPSIVDSKSGKAAFRLSSGTDAPSPQTPPGLFSGPGWVTADWNDVDSFTYGGLAVGLFIFDIGSDGKATAVNPAAFRITLDRTA